MSEKNSSQNMVTAVAIIVALAAIAYAFMVKMDNKTIEVSSATEKTFEVTEQNPVVMSINGHDVTRVEVMNNFMKSGSQLPQGANLNQIFPLLQEQYLVGELIKNAANDRGIDENHSVVQERLMDVKDQAIRAAYLKDVGEEMVTDEDIKNAYEDVIGSQPTAMERKARHILLEDEAKANALIIKLNQGADFVKLAEENSTGPSAPRGGDLGYFTKDEMVPEFAIAAFDLELGKFTQKPVKTQFGYHIILAEEEREREKPAFEDVKDQLANQLRQAATAEKIQELRQNSEVVVYDFEGNEMKAEEEVQNSNDATAEQEETAAEQPTEETPTNDVVEEEPVTE